MHGSVKAGCKPGPRTVLTDEEEDLLARYLIQMSEMGFGPSCDTVMYLAYNIAEKSNDPIPLSMTRLDALGLMVSADGTHILLFVFHSLSHTAGHCLQM